MNNNHLSKTEFYIDKKLMHKDILKRLSSINKPQKYLTEKLGISRSTFWRLSKGKEITTDTFLILLNWLENPPERYIKTKTN